MAVFPTRLFFALACLCAAPSLMAAAWQAPAEVIYVEEGAPVPRATVEAALRYALSSWSARIDLPLYWNATTASQASAADYIDGAIVVRWTDEAIAPGSGATLLRLASTRRWVYRTSGEIAAAEIQLRRAAFASQQGTACLTHVLLHELGHALGIGHLLDPKAVMYKNLHSCHHTLTASDIAAAPYPQHICHAELLADLSIYIPVVAVGTRSFASRLRFEAGAWNVVDYAEVPPHPECDDTRLVNGNLLFTRLWTPTRTWQGELQAAGSQRWSLKSAY